MIDPLHDRPILAALAGAVAISFSGILFRVAHVSPSTGAVLRCLYALPILWPLAWLDWLPIGDAVPHAPQVKLPGVRAFSPSQERDLVHWGSASQWTAWSPSGRTHKPARRVAPH